MALLVPSFATSMSAYNPGPTVGILGGSFTDVRRDINNYYGNVSIHEVERGIDKLLGAAYPDAMHNSQVRYPPPKCHPETRKALLHEIHDWVHDRTEPILWLHGAAGAGKSAIAQTIAETCARIGALAASFFFSRGADRRNVAKYVFSTIVYQITVSMPETRSAIARIVESDPSIFSQSLDVQVQQLVVGLKSIPDWSLRKPSLVVIDGLDECEVEDDQEVIVSVIGRLITSEVPLRFLIASRPEPQILIALDKLDIRGGVYRLHLRLGSSSEEGSNDIHIFLRSGFDEILRKHREKIVPVSRPWPPDSVVQHLSAKAGGIFIYATTILKFIDDDDAWPTEQLDLVLSSVAEPFAPLDALYIQILSRCSNIARVLKVLEFFLVSSLGDLTIHACEKLLGLRQGEVSMLLRRLHSILQIKRHRLHSDKFCIQFLHASFKDFIHDPSRSTRFYIGRKDAIAHTLHRCLDYIKSLADYDVDNLPEGAADALYPCLEQGLTDAFLNIGRDSIHQSQLIASLRAIPQSAWNHLHYLLIPLIKEHFPHVIDGLLSIYWSRDPDPPILNHLKAAHATAMGFMWKEILSASPRSVTVLVTLFEDQDFRALREWRWVRCGFDVHPLGYSLLRTEDFPLLPPLLCTIKDQDEKLQIHSTHDLDKWPGMVYLISILQDPTSPYYSDPADGHSYMARQCLRLLTSTERYMSDTTAIPYTNRYWANHLSLSIPGDESILAYLEDLCPGGLQGGLSYDEATAVIQWLKKSNDSGSLWGPVDPLLSRWEGYLEEIEVTEYLSKSDSG